MRASGPDVVCPVHRFIQSSTGLMGILVHRAIRCYFSGSVLCRWHRRPVHRELHDPRLRPPLHHTRRDDAHPTRPRVKAARLTSSTFTLDDRDLDNSALTCHGVSRSAAGATGTKMRRRSGVRRNSICGWSETASVSLGVLASAVGGLVGAGELGSMRFLRQTLPRVRNPQHADDSRKVLQCTPYSRGCSHL
jgi:hypothetical protein